MSRNGVYEGPFDRFMRNFRKMRRERRQKPVSVTELQEQFTTLLNISISPGQAAKYLREGVRRGLIRETRVYFDTKGLNDIPPTRLYSLESEESVF